MRSRLFVCLFAVVGLVAWSGALGFTEDEKPKPMTEEEMWAKAMEWAEPGEHHKALDVMCGTWKTEGTMYGESEDYHFTGKCETKWILGGRFLETVYEGPFMGETFKGRAWTGYDNGNKEFQTAWIMNMATGIEVSRGTYDEEKKSLTMKSKSLMPDGITYESREVIAMKSKDEYRSTTWSKAPGGEETKEMEIVYKRVK